VATAVLNSASNLEVIDWAVNPNTGVITRKASSTVEEALRVAVSTIGNQIFTAVQNFHVIVEAGVWGYNDSSFLQIASQQQEYGGEVSAAPLNSGNYSVTAAVTFSGDLQVDVWYYYSIG
jgi:hypothetical protein